MDGTEYLKKADDIPELSLLRAVEEGLVAGIPEAGTGTLPVSESPSRSLPHTSVT